MTGNSGFKYFGNRWLICQVDNPIKKWTHRYYKGILEEAVGRGCVRLLIFNSVLLHYVVELLMWTAIDIIFLIPTSETFNHNKISIWG